MKTKGVIIQGSSRSNGNTGKIVSYVHNLTGFPVIDLRSRQIGGFDYEHRNKDDDLLPLLRDLADNFDILIFATPVYWYAMSGIMKNFFDRIADCLRIEKETGRKLRGKAMAMISCGSGPELAKGFEVPFVKSADYLGMYYLGDLHTWLENELISEPVQRKLDAFIEEKINAQ